MRTLVRFEKQVDRSFNAVSDMGEVILKVSPFEKFSVGESDEGFDSDKKWVFRYIGVPENYNGIYQIKIIQLLPGEETLSRENLISRIQMRLMMGGKHECFVHERTSGLLATNGGAARNGLLHVHKNREDRLLSFLRKNNLRKEKVFSETIWYEYYVGERADGSVSRLDHDGIESTKEVMLNGVLMEAKKVINPNFIIFYVNNLPVHIWYKNQMARNRVESILTE